MDSKIRFNSAVNVPKGWGQEILIANYHGSDGFPTGYSGKILSYTKVGAVSSMHYHKLKHETFYVLAGKFDLRYFDLQNADSCRKFLEIGDIVVIPPCSPHQIICKEIGIILEFASTDYSDDNYRIAKGDSQKASV